MQSESGIYAHLMSSAYINFNLQLHYKTPLLVVRPRRTVNHREAIRNLCVPLPLPCAIAIIIIINFITIIVFPLLFNLAYYELVNNVK